MFHSTRLRRAALAAPLAIALAVPTGLAAGAAPAPPGPSTSREPGPRRTSPEDPVRPLQASPRTPDVDRDRSARRGDDTRGYPRQQVLVEPAPDPADAAIKLGLTPYHGIAPRLNDLQEASRRVSVEVLGRSARGHDLHLVTVTSPESAAETRRQQQIKDQIVDRPAQAARDRSIPRDYKAPIFVNNNIHGNEWEGTDAALRLIDDLATSTDPAVDRLLDRSRLYFVVTMNPDGRIGNTRANGNGFDMNRDFITATQSEVRAVRDGLIEAQPLVMLDLHGYVNGTLIEPTTPPHGENYEYDLFIKHAYPNGLAMERAVNGLGYTEAKDGVRPAQIPFRDSAEGWDDWPPIFTPQYAAFHGAVAHTVEIPLRVNNASYNLPVGELRRRSAINTDVAEAAMRAGIDFTDRKRAELIADQIEIFRRGTAGEAQRPVTPEMFPEIGPEDVYTTEFPRAYVIPAGSTQRSAVAAARLVDHLVANDVRVTQARTGFSAGGRRYPAGSYLVDMHQPKRGLANVMLADGSDISDKVDAMYDISGWSHRLLWGATVDIVRDGDLVVASRPVTAASPTGSVAAPPGDLALRLDDAADFRALDALLDADAEVRLTGDGTVRVAASARRLATTLADRYGVTFGAATGSPSTPLDDVVVAAAAPADELWALAEMGFQVRPVSTTTLNAGFDWNGVDTLYVSGGLSYAELRPAARTAFGAFLSGGGGVVGRGSTGATFNTEAGLLTATRIAGRSDANGVIAVGNSAGPLTARATPHSFVSAPSWFTGLGSEVTVEQRYGSQGPLVSGHWRPRPDGTGGPDAARGQAVVVRGVDETGAGVVLFGSEPLYRAHPKGQYALAGRALLWATTPTGG